MGDFKNPKDFTDSHDFENLMKEPTCFKYTSLTTTGIFCTYRKGCFMKSSTNETWILLDHHKLIDIFLKSSYAKGKLKFVYYRYFKNFNKELLKKKIFQKFSETLVILTDCMFLSCHLRISEWIHTL